MKHDKWSCPKCGNIDYETDEFRAAGGFLAKVFDVQNKRFSTVSCSQCHYTEIYRTTSSTLGSVFDFFTN